MSTDADAPEKPAKRVVSIDAYRGFVMFLMLAEMLHLPALARQFPGSVFWEQVRFHTSHVGWFGCSLHDMIQPSFSFLVGLALVFSLAKRQSTGYPLGWSILHAVLRSIVLIFLGVFLRSIDHKQTNFTFEDTLSQIGLGYLPLFAIAFLPWRWVAGMVLLILVGYWGAFALYPAPAADYNYAAVGVGSKWPHHAAGFASHWNINSNLAWDVDRWFLNLFPRAERFEFNRGGYSTLSFIPTLATMLLGLLAGRLMQANGTPWRKVGWLAGIGLVLLAAGWGLGELGVCPVVKKIWTPTWVLFSGGLCFLFLAAFHASTDAIGYGGWSYPLRVIGANSILIYVVADISSIRAWIVRQIQVHLGNDVFAYKWDGKDLEPQISGAAVLLIYWLALWWLYTRKVFVRV